jgi:hypothetical protein
MLRTFAIAIAGAGIFAILPLTNARACDDDRYPCPIRSEALIQETVPAPDQPAPDEPQKKSAQPHKKATQPASSKAHAKRDREAPPRTPAGAKMSKPAVLEQAPDAVSQKAPEAAPAAVAPPRADERSLTNESRGGNLLTTAGTAWPVPSITEDAADTPATSINTADAASNAVQIVDPNEVNELDREASVDTSWVNYLLWMLGAALAAAFALWFFSRVGFLFGRRTANAG